MSELPADCNTRVSVKINDADQSCPSPFGPTFSRPHWTDKQEQISISSLMKDPSYIILLISGVDVEINIKSPSYEASHAPNWVTIDAEHFLKDLLSTVDAEERDFLIRAHAATLSRIEDDNGRIYGRAALVVTPTGYRLGGLSVGGFVMGAPDAFRFPFVGLLAGRNDYASRESAEPDVPPNVLAKWATQQAASIQTARVSAEDLVEVAHTIVEMGGDSLNLPFLCCAGDYISLRQFESVIERHREVLVLLYQTYQSQFEWQNDLDIAMVRTLKKAKDNLMLIRIEGLGRFDKGLFRNNEFDKQLARKGGGTINGDDIAVKPRSFSLMLSVCAAIWKKPIKLEIKRAQIYDVNYYVMPEEEWILSVSAAS